MYPDERSLVKKMEGKPFVILGINSDADRKALKKVLAEERLTWRSWWDGGSTEGPIASRGGVSAWTTTYVRAGPAVIPYNQIRGPGLDTAVQQLLKETGTR